MNDANKVIARLANIIIVAVAIMLSGVLIRNYLSSSPAVCNGNGSQVQEEVVKPGEKINLPDVNWGQGQQTLLLALSTGCHFCSESTPFYQQLVKERGGNTRIIAVLPQAPVEGRNYLNRRGVSVDDIKQVRLDAIGIGGTPTLLLLDANGTVKDAWVGKLGQAEEAKVLDQVRQGVAQERENR